MRKLRKKSYFLLTSLLFIICNFHLNSTYPCYPGGPTDCLPPNQWNYYGTVHYTITIPEILPDGCEIGLDVEFWRCGSEGDTKISTRITLIQPEPNCSCITEFNNYINGGDDNIRTLFELAYQNLGKKYLEIFTSDPEYTDYFNCNKENHRVMRMTRFFEGNCSQYCVYPSNNTYGIVEHSCVAEYCCGVYYFYCWDPINNVSVIENIIRFGEGGTECEISPEPPDCPPFKGMNPIHSTRCFNNCQY